MQKYFDNVLGGSTGFGAIAGASVLVKNLNGTTATIFADNGTLTKSNPITTDAAGYFEFYAPDGRYTIEVTAPGFGPVSRQDILLEDPQSASPVVASTLSVSGPATFDGDVIVPETPAGPNSAASAFYVSKIANIASEKQFVSVKDFGAVGDGVTNDAPAFFAAQSAGDVIVVPEPSVSYRFSSSLLVQSNKRFVSVGRGACPITTNLGANVVQFLSVSNAALVGFEITGAHSGTSYMINMQSSKNCEVDLSIKNGNSGVQLVNTSDCTISLKCENMRGTGLKLEGASATGNIVKSFWGRNISGFGVYLNNGPSENVFSEIYKDTVPSTVTTFQATNDALDLANGRLGLEALGVTINCSKNNFGKVTALGTADNGVSITGDRNVCNSIIARNCDNDGLHIYGELNAVSSVVATGNEQSGVGISQSNTTGTASNNTVVSAVVEANQQYGLKIEDGSVLAENNKVFIVELNNTLGAVDPTTNLLKNHIIIDKEPFTFRYSRGGNVRGENAVDFQVERTSGTHVASGNASFLGSGVRNSARGANCVTVGGSDNDTANTSAFVGGGASNNATSSYSNIPGGRNNTANALYSWVPGGRYGSVKGRYASWAYSSDTGALGRQQVAGVSLHTTTTNSTETRLISDAPSGAPTLDNQFIVLSNSVLNFRAMVTARNTANNEVKSWSVTGTIKNTNGTTSLVGAPTITTVAQDAGANSWTIAVIADNTLDALAINVTGADATSIRWHAVVEASEVA